MKKITIKSLSAWVGLFLMITGCNKIADFGNTNVNPNGTSTPVTAALLTAVESGLGGNGSGGAGEVLFYATSIVAGQYAQYFAETQYPGTSLYTAPIFNYSNIYSTDLYDLQNIINQNSDPATKGIVASSGSNVNQIAIARILKAYLFWTVTDRWGDIPYSEALKGGAIKLPKFDKQQDIYADLIKELKEAASQFDDNGLVVKGDILMNYSGTGNAATVNSKWRKFANSLRMLIALRTSKVYPNAGQWAATEFKNALSDAGGYISSNSENVALTYANTTYANPFFINYVTNSRVDNAESSTMTDLLSSLNDPRLSVYGTTPNGFPYGLDRAHATAITSGIAYIFKGQSTQATDPVTITSAAVVTLARAEAAERGWTTENAETLYNQAVTLAFAQYGFTATQASNFLAQPSVKYGTDNIAKIATQRWIALYPDGVQAWAEWRRTGYPILRPSQYAVNPGGQIPRRYIYGTDEYSLNEANVKAAAARYTGGDNQDSRMWWDAQ
jgi:hypothetical protein